MGLMERLQEIAKGLPENELAEVIGFAEALKARRGAARIAVPDAAIDVELMHAVRSRCEGGFAWRREESYGCGLG